MSRGSNFRPMRTCVGCRERQPQDELIRLRYVKGRVVISRSGDDTPGRSVYLCPCESCWRDALKRGRLVFKSAKRDKMVVNLEPREQEGLLLKLRSYTREQGVLN